MKVRYSVVALIFLSPVGLVCGQQREPQAPPPATQVSAASIFANYPNLQAQAKEFGDAFVRKDFERLTELTYPKSIEIGGGKESLISEVTGTARQLQAEGIEMLSWTPTDVTQLLRDSGSLYAVVPMTARIKVHEDLFDWYLCQVGISSDQGQHWTFVPARSRLRDMFPQVVDKLNLCPERPAVKMTSHQTLDGPR
jgi:hypothetical protein